MGPLAHQECEGEDPSPDDPPPPPDPDPIETEPAGGYTVRLLFETNEPVTSSGVWDGSESIFVEGAARCEPIYLGSMLANFKGYEFRFKGPLLKLADAPPHIEYPGYATAWYASAAVDNTVLSVDGQKKLEQAEIRLACKTVVKVNIYGQKVGGAWVVAIEVRGRVVNAKPGPSGSGGTGDEAWASVTDDGEEFGEGDGWEDAVHNWKWHRSCSGVKLFENGVRVCATGQYGT